MLFKAVVTGNWRKRKTLLGLLAASIALSACGGGRPEFGTGATPCFQALPIAKHAVPISKTFIGVRLISSKAIERKLSISLPGNQKNVCLVAFKNQVGKQSLPPGYRRYSLVTVSLTSKSVLKTTQVNKLPIDFRHNLSIS
ncbi:MAG: hypothetical protein M1288_00485 [Actinobacteria bacterium]|nr:hypothetical protein [Actinomycetota bacterium]